MGRRGVHGIIEHVTRPPLTATTLVVVAVGGTLGALLRWALTEVVPDGGGIPWTTFAINVAGCFVLGVLPRLVRRAPHDVGLALGPGLLGGFTTFAAYADQARALVASGQAGLAAAYVVGTVAACLAAAALGHCLAHGRGPLELDR